MEVLHEPRQGACPFHEMGQKASVLKDLQNLLKVGSASGVCLDQDLMDLQSAPNRFTDLCEVDGD